MADIRALLSQLDPAPKGPLSGTETARADLLLERLAGDIGSGQLQPATSLPSRPFRLRTPTPRRAPRRWALIVAGSVVALVVAGTVVALQAGGRPAVASPALPTPLAFGHGSHQAAVSFLDSVVALQQEETPTSGIVYSETQGYALGADVASAQRSTTYVVTTVRQVWVRADCTALEESRTQQANAATGANVGVPGATSAEPNWQDTNCRMPSSPQAVAFRLVGPGASSDQELRDYALADGVMTQLGLGTASPAQTSALYQVLATLPDTFYAGTVRDDSGRIGQAVGVPVGTVNSGPPSPSVSTAPPGCAHAVPGEAWEYLVVDPATGRPLQVEEIDSTPPCALQLPQRPTVGQYNVILNAGRVFRVGEVPR